MLLRRVTGLVILMIVVGVSAACSQPRPHGYLLYWGFDKVFVGKLETGRVTRESVGLTRPIENLISTSVAGRRLAVVGLQRPSTRLMPFLVELPGGVVTAVVQKPARHVALAPDGQRLAFTTNSRSVPEGYVADIVVRSLATGKDVLLLEGQASLGTAITWHPNGRSLTFDVQRVTSESKDPETEVVTRSYDSWIKSADLETGAVRQLLEGSGPAWSPDGNRLAYYRNGSLFVYDTVRRESAKVYARGRRQADFTGTVHWSPGGDHIAANVGAGAMEERLECLVIDVASGKAASLGTSSYWCGPWLNDTVPSKSASLR